MFHLSAEELQQEVWDLKAKLVKAELVIKYYAAMGDDDNYEIDIQLERAMELRPHDPVTINLGGKLISEKARVYLAENTDV